MRALLTLLIALHPQPAWASCRPSLVDVLRQLERPHIQAEQIDPQTVFLYIGDRHQPTAVLLYRVMPDGVLMIDAARTLPEHQRQGLNRQLFAEMLRRHPDTVEIQSTLMEDNLAEYRRVKQEHPDWTCAQVVALTAAMRVRAGAGFGRVTECGMGPHSILLTVTR